jgi:hypothetical protein
MSNSMRGGFFASPNKITRAVDDLFLIAAGVQIYLTSAANRHVPGEECIAIDEKRGDLLPSGGRKDRIDFVHGAGGQHGYGLPDANGRSLQCRLVYLGRRIGGIDNRMKEGSLASPVAS